MKETKRPTTVKNVMRRQDIMPDTVATSHNVKRLITEISDATQAFTLNEISQAVEQLGTMLRQNTALIEQVITVTENLPNQSDQLQQRIGHLRL